MTLVAENLSFRYPRGERDIISGFSLTLTGGERLGLFAPSGTGKTTLFQLLAGYLHPTGGHVLLDGRPLHSFRGYSPVQLIFQHPELVLNPRLRLRESLREAGMQDAALLADLGIEKAWLDRYPAELSGGELQRFCIARALSENTRFLLADEITAMHDLVTQAQLWQVILEQAHRRNLGLLIASHSDALLERVCNRRIALITPGTGQN